jgi:hypothetical protein
VSKGRVQKRCACCEDRIKIGKPAYTLTYVAYGEYDNLSVCVPCYEEREKDGDAVIEEYFQREYGEELDT